MKSIDVKKTVSETLMQTRMRIPKGSCFGTNLAGQELCQITDDITEELFKAVVEIDYLIESGRKSFHDYLGVTYVFGAMFLNGAKNEKADVVVEVVLSLSPKMLFECVNTLPVFFQMTKGGYNYDIQPPVEYINLARHLSRSASGRLQESGSRVLRHLTRSATGKMN